MFVLFSMKLILVSIWTKLIFVSTYIKLIYESIPTKLIYVPILIKWIIVSTSTQQIDFDETDICVGFIGIDISVDLEESVNLVDSDEIDTDICVGHAE